MLHLSRLLLETRSPRTIAEVRDPYQLHRTLAKAFAPAGSDADAGRAALDDARLLFRVDADGARDTVAVLVQSRTRPQWEQLTQTSGWLRRAPDLVAFSPVLPEGTLLAFRLRANPSVKREGKRRGLFRVEERLAWLARKAEAGGFSLVRAEVADERVLRASTGEGPSRGEFAACRYEGVLRVAESRRFAETIAGGIGAAKGFGFGLLSVAPHRG